MRDACCPDPRDAFINPEEHPDVKPYRDRCKWLYYGQWVYIALEVFLSGNILSGIFGLFRVWIFYMAYATMHFCQNIICIIILVMLCFTVGPIMFAPAPVGLKIVCGLMLAYDIIGVVWQYQAFKVFSEKYNQMMGGSQQ